MFGVTSISESMARTSHHLRGYVPIMARGPQSFPCDAHEEHLLQLFWIGGQSLPEFFLVVVYVFQVFDIEVHRRCFVQFVILTIFIKLSICSLGACSSHFFPGEQCRDVRFFWPRQSL